MMENQVSQSNEPDNEIYLKIWEIEQAHVRTRWTITTFFMGISFAVVSFTFQKQAEVDIQVLSYGRIFGLLIYWFAYALFLRFHSYNRRLRDYLRQMENEGLTSITLRRSDERMARQWFSASKLLLLFGVIYSIMILFSIGIEL